MNRRVLITLTLALAALFVFGVTVAACGGKPCTAACMAKAGDKGCAHGAGDSKGCAHKDAMMKGFKAVQGDLAAWDKSINDAAFQKSLQEHVKSLTDGHAACAKACAAKGGKEAKPCCPAMTKMEAGFKSLEGDLAKMPVSLKDAAFQKSLKASLEEILKNHEECEKACAAKEKVEGAKVPPAA